MVLQVKYILTPWLCANLTDSSNKSKLKFAATALIPKLVAPKYIASAPNFMADSKHSKSPAGANSSKFVKLSPRLLKLNQICFKLTQCSLKFRAKKTSPVFVFVQK